jgi:hypothetical protein
MSLKAGVFNADGTLSAGSMSATIERALNDLVAVAVDEDPMGRRRLALAIARGVIKHLADNQAAVRTRVLNWTDPVSTHEESATIDVDLGGWS